MWKQKYSGETEAAHARAQSRPDFLSLAPTSLRMPSVVKGPRSGLKKALEVCGEDRQGVDEKRTKYARACLSALGWEESRVPLRQVRGSAQRIRILVHFSYAAPPGTITTGSSVSIRNPFRHWPELTISPFISWESLELAFQLFGFLGSLDK